MRSRIVFLLGGFSSHNASTPFLCFFLPEFLPLGAVPFSTILTRTKVINPANEQEELVYHVLCFPAGVERLVDDFKLQVARYVLLYTAVA